MAVKGDEFGRNDLAELPVGEQLFSGVKFKIDEGVVQLASLRTSNMPAEEEGILVNRNASRLYVLHGTQYTVADGTVIGEYKLHYEDGSTASMPIVFGQDVRDWWTPDRAVPTARGRVVWIGSNPLTEERQCSLRLYLGVWENPHPQKKITRLDYISTNDTDCAPFCLAITVEEP
jgi:hypothetical protein